MSFVSKTNDKPRYQCIHRVVSEEHAEDYILFVMCERKNKVNNTCDQNILIGVISIMQNLIVIISTISILSNTILNLRCGDNDTAALMLMTV